MIDQSFFRVASFVGTLAVFALAAQAFAAAPGAAGDVYVSDGDAPGVYQYDGLTGAHVPNGAQSAFARRAPRSSYANTWGPDGNLYVANNGAVGRWSIDKFNGTTGALISTVVSHEPAAGASVAKGLVFGPDGDLYLGDWFQHRIERYAAGTFALKAVYNGAGGGILGTPNGMTFSPTGNLMVISGGFNQVLTFSTAGNGINLLGTFATLGLSQQPQDLTYGPNGNLFVTGGGNDFGGGANVMEFNGITGTYIRDIVTAAPGVGLTSSLRFDGHGRLLVSVGGTGGFNVNAYDATSGNPLGTFIPELSGGITFPYFISIKPVPAPGALAIGVLGVAQLARRRRR